MKKFKMPLVVASLMLLTVGVFASRPKFAVELDARDTNTNTWKVIATGATLGVNYSTTGTVQAFITDKAGVQFPIYENQSLTTPVYAIVTF